MSSIKAGFIGLGNMGSLMVKTMVKNGLVPTVYDLRAEAIEKMKALGAKGASSCRGVAEVSDVIVSVVRDIQETEEVMFGRDGVWEGIRQGAIMVITSTVTSSYCQQLYSRAKERGFHVVDAAISAESRNFTPGQESAELTLMVGGDEEAVNRCQPVFKTIAKNIFHVGGIGTGQACKLVNNLAMYANTMVAQECLNLGIKAGLDLDKLIQAISVSTGYSRGLNIIARRLRDPGFPVGLPTKPSGDKAPVKSLGDKDREYAMELAESSGASTPITRLMAELDIETVYDALSARIKQQAP
jgi:2-hydroxymethylglutarate dehydrogenase